MLQEQLLKPTKVPFVHASPRHSRCGCQTKRKAASLQASAAVIFANAGLEARTHTHHAPATGVSTHVSAPRDNKILTLLRFFSTELPPTEVEGDVATSDQDNDLPFGMQNSCYRQIQAVMEEWKPGNVDALADAAQTIVDDLLVKGLQSRLPAGTPKGRVSWKPGDIERSQ